MRSDEYSIRGPNSRAVQPPPVRQQYGLWCGRNAASSQQASRHLINTRGSLCGIKALGRQQCGMRLPANRSGTTVYRLARARTGHYSDYHEWQYDAGGVQFGQGLTGGRVIVWRRAVDTLPSGVLAKTKGAQISE